MNFTDYSRKWESQILPMKKPATQASFRCHLKRARSGFGARELAELTEDFIQQHISGVSQELGAGSVSNYWTTIRIILHRARREGLIQNIPEPTLPKIFRAQQPSFTPEQMRKIINSAPEPYATLFLTLAETGCRIGEVLGLKGDDIATGRLEIKRSLFNGREQTPKTNNSVRNLRISTELLRRLQRCAIGNAKGYLFENRGHTKTQGDCLRSLEKTEVGAGRGHHAFRRGNAKLLMELGCPAPIIAYRLGHAPTVTERYIQAGEGADSEWAERIYERIMG